MIRRLCCSVSWIVLCLALVAGSLPHAASALDTPNVLMTIDGMTMLAQGLFVNGTPADGFNTFRFGPPQYAGGTLGKYRSFFYVKSTGTTEASGISHNARYHSDTPETWNGSAYGIVTGVDLDSEYFSVVDRANFGQRFDPAEYQIEVKYKPNVGIGGGVPDNTAPGFSVGLDQEDGFVFDAQTGVYKRANDAFAYTVGAFGDFNNNGTVDSADYVVWRANDVANVALPNDNGLTTQAGRYGLWRQNFGRQNLNTYYNNAPKDADGFATYTVPVTQPDFVQRGFYFMFGDGTFRTDNVVTGNGRVFNEQTMTWNDVNDGLDPLSFGGGATDPSRPGSQLKVPNGVPLISVGVNPAEQGLSLQFKYITLKRITPNPIMARIDSNSGLTFKFGSGFGRSTSGPPIHINGDNIDLLPSATDQISRFDENGMTNLIFNMRTPDANEVHRFLIRGGPNAQVFDGSTATVNVRAKLLEPLTNPGIAQNLTIVAKDLDGNDTGPGTGADEYTFNLALNQFNTSTFTTVSIPLSSFTLSPFVPTVPNGTAGSGPFGFSNPGDGLKTNFDLYEFGGLIPAGGGLLHLELEYMEIRIPGAASGFAAVPEPTAWLLAGVAGVFIGFSRRRFK
jgi:hypothetical protein